MMSSNTSSETEFVTLPQALDPQVTVCNVDTANEDERSLTNSITALPPTDTGYRAWLCLGACFLVNSLIWGFAFSWGVLQEYYMSHEPFSSQKSGIPAVGTTATGLMYLTLPLYFLGFQRWPRLRTYSTWASVPLAAIALVGASFTNTVPQLLFCQGILYALAGNTIVTPSIAYLDEWFVRRKGLAIGVMWAGDGFGGAIMPFLLQALLSKYGFRWVSIHKCFATDCG